MTFSFFDDQQNKEFVARLQVKCEDVRKAHREAVASISADFAQRGLSSTTAASEDIFAQHLRQQQQLAGAARDEIFKIVEADEIDLAVEDEALIRNYIRGVLEQPLPDAIMRCLSGPMGSGLPSAVETHLRTGWNYMVGCAVEIEATRGVTIALTDIERNRRDAKKEKAEKRRAMVFSAAAGAFFGVVSTLAAQWLLKYFSP